MKWRYLPILLSLWVCAGCQKVIHVNLNEAEPKIVIEGIAFEGTDTVSVRITKTGNYFGDDPIAIIDDAQVSIREENNAPISIPNVGNGYYKLPAYTAIAGKKYHLEVIAEGQQFTSSSYLPYPVAIDSFRSEFKPKQGFRDEGFEVSVFFTDPDSTPNFYRLIYSINDTLRNEPRDLMVFNDKYNNGNVVRINFFERFLENDSLHFELRGMDEALYLYFSSLSTALGSGASPAPANPVSNIKGGALGYFGVFTQSKKHLIVK